MRAAASEHRRSSEVGCRMEHEGRRPVCGEAGAPRCNSRSSVSCRCSDFTRHSWGRRRTSSANRGRSGRVTQPRGPMRQSHRTTNNAAPASAPSCSPRPPTHANAGFATSKLISCICICTCFCAPSRPIPVLLLPPVAADWQLPSPLLPKGRSRVARQCTASPSLSQIDRQTDIPQPRPLSPPAVMPGSTIVSLSLETTRPSWAVVTRHPLEPRCAMVLIMCKAQPEWLPAVSLMNTESIPFSI